MQNSNPIPVLAFLGVVCLFFTGCSNGDGTVTVTGTVQFDGKPLPHGEVLFRKADGDKKGFGGRVLDGKYEIAVEPGNMTIEVLAVRAVPGKFVVVGDVEEPVMEMYIPAKYNTATTLTAEITNRRTNVVPLLLTSH